MKTCISILFICLQFSLFAQTTWHVRSDAVGASTGLSWTDAFTDLHFALDLAQPGDQVWVAQGLYRTDTAANRERYFELPSGVRLLGGFNGTETSADQSDPAGNPTILSGNIGNHNDSLDNAFCVLYLFHPDSTTLVDGFTVEHGYADKVGGSNQAPGRSGAGVFVYGIQGMANPTFRRFILRYNTAVTNGGGMYVNGTTGFGNTPLLKKCRFIGNKTVVGNGGGMYWTGGGASDRGVEMEDCVFENNSSGLHGGAVFISRNRGKNETINIKKCQFYYNSVGSWGGVLFYDVADSSFQHRVLIDSCLMDGNNGGAGTIVNFFSNNIPYRLQFVFENNTVIRTTPSSNFPSNDNTGLFYWGSYNPGTFDGQDTIVFRNNLFTQNTAFEMINSPGFRGTIFFENNTMSHNKSFDSGFTQLIGFSANKTYVRNNLFYANRGYLNYYSNLAFFNGNILSGNQYTPAFPYNAPLLIINSIANESIRLSNNLFINNIDRSEIITTALNTGILNLYHNIFYNNKHGTTGQNSIPIWRDLTQVKNNIFDFEDCSTIPNFQCLPNNLHQTDLELFDTAAGDYRLLPCSPGIDGGENANVYGLLYDYLGNTRIVGYAVDIGPYEDQFTGLSAGYLIEPSCANLSTGSLTFVTDNTGCPPYEVSWNNEGPFAGLTASPLPAGPVSVTLTDGVGRTFVVQVTVPLTPSPELVSFVSHASSATTADGAVVVEPPAGSGPYQYLWSTGDTSSIISGLLPGMYTLTLTDAAGCQYTYAYEVSFNIGTTEQDFEMPSFWPNPASNLVQIRWHGCDVLEVYSMHGQKLLNLSETGGNHFSVKQLPTGLYHVVFLKNGRMVHRSRLVVTN